MSPTTASTRSPRPSSFALAKFCAVLSRTDVISHHLTSVRLRQRAIYPAVSAADVQQPIADRGGAAMSNCVIIHAVVAALDSRTPSIPSR